MSYSNEVNLLILRWIDFLDKEKKYSLNTSSAYRGDLLSFLHFLGKHIANEVTCESLNNLSVTEIRSWLACRRTEHISNRSNTRSLSSLNSFMAFLKKRNLIDENMATKIDRPKISKKLPKPIKYSDIKLMIESVPLIYKGSTPDWVILRDKTLIVLLYATGLRISEAISLHVSDVKDTLIIQGKGNKERKIPLMSIAKKYIIRLVDACPYVINVNSKIFFSITGKFMQRTAAANIFAKLRSILKLPEEISPHALRHSFASHLVENSADIRTVQELLGHESLSTTQQYTEISQKKLLESYTMYHPLSKNKK